MAQTYKQLAKQIAALQQEADKLREAELADVVARTKATIAEYGITAGDLGLASSARKVAGKSGKAKPKGATEAKFGDGEGNFWGGRGPRPQWLRTMLEAGHALEEFAL